MITNGNGYASGVASYALDPTNADRLWEESLRLLAEAGQGNVQHRWCSPSGSVVSHSEGGRTQSFRSANDLQSLEHGNIPGSYRDLTKDELMREHVIFFLYATLGSGDHWNHNWQLPHQERTHPTHLNVLAGPGQVSVHHVPSHVPSNALLRVPQKEGGVYERGVVSLNSEA